MASNLDDLTLSTIDHNKGANESKKQVPPSPSKKRLVSPANNKFSAFGRTLKNDEQLLDSARTQKSARKKKPIITVTSFDDGEAEKVQEERIQQQ